MRALCGADALQHRDTQHSCNRSSKRLAVKLYCMDQHESSQHDAQQPKCWMSKEVRDTGSRCLNRMPQHRDVQHSRFWDPMRLELCQSLHASTPRLTTLHFLGLNKFSVVGLLLHAAAFQHCDVQHSKSWVPKRLVL